MNSFKKFMSKNSTNILTGVSIIGVLATTVLAVKATPKAVGIIREEQERIYNTPDDPTPTIEEIKIDPKTIIKLTWKLYIPAAVVGVTTIASIVSTHGVDTKRATSLAGAYTIAQTAFTEYQSKVKDIIGEKKEEEVRGDIATDHMEKNPITDSNPIVVTGNGESLVFDTLSGRYFKFDISKIQQIENELNRRLINEDWVSLNDLYYSLGLEGIRMGDDLGWISDNMIVFKTGSKLQPETNEPTFVLDYEVEPKYNSYKGI